MKSFKQYIKILYRKIFPDHIYFLKRELAGCDSVLDLGCGQNSSIQYCNVPFSVGVELFEPYLLESRKKGIHNQYIKRDITKIKFDDKSFDAVILIDVLEHISKEEGYALLKKIERWAKKKIIVFTPNGFIEQKNIDDNPLQDHKSDWRVKEFKKLGFRVFGINGWKKLRGPGAGFKYRPFLLSRLISELSQKIVHHYPELAFHIFSVREIVSLKNYRNGQNHLYN